jgi:uncharacterized protein (TIGR04141 family)
MSEKTNHLNIYMIRPEFSDFEKIVKPDTKSIPIEGVGTFYIEDSHPRSPEWARDFFGGSLGDEVRLVTSSAKGVLLVEIQQHEEKHCFAVTFGFGRYLLEDDVIEERFGLKVVLNTVDAASLRSIDKTTLGSVPKQTREQMSRESGAASFGIDIEQDLVNAVTGKSRDQRFGRTLSGRDALVASVKVDVHDIKDFLGICIENYKSDVYKTDFGWIDQIREIRSASMRDALDQLMITRVAAGELEKIWMAVPDIVNWPDVKGFRYLKAKRAELCNDLDVSDFIDALGLPDTLTLEMLKAARIFAIATRTDDPMETWSAYRCLYAEIEYQGAVCILNNGKWYEIIKDFTLRIQGEFDALTEATLQLPNYHHSDEGTYNEGLPATVPDSYCMDRKMIFHGGGHSQIEFCDLLTKEKQLVHVKRYGGSSLLSYLFSQGVVSGELFVSDPSFRKSLNEKLPDDYKLVDPEQQPNARDYEVIFAIISKSANPLDIPFFSKVSLSNARRRLVSYGYKVTRKKILAEA